MLAFTKSAFETTSRIKRLVLLHYSATLIFGLVAVFPLHSMLSRATEGRSLTAFENNLLNPSFFMDLGQMYASPFLFNTWIGVLLVLLLAVFNFFLSGGTLSAMNQPDQNWQTFWSQCAALFPSFVAALALLTLVWLPVLFLLALLAFYIEPLIGFTDVVMPRVINLLIIAPAIFCWHRSLDMVRIHLAKWPGDGVVSACFSAVLFVVTHFSSLVGLSLLYLGALGLITLLGFTVLTGPTNAGFGVFLLFAALTQLSVLIRLYIRMAFLAHENLYYHSRHA
jgi:hypothetical protein